MNVTEEMVKAGVAAYATVRHPSRYDGVQGACGIENHERAIRAAIRAALEAVQASGTAANGAMAEIAYGLQDLCDALGGIADGSSLHSVKQRMSAVLAQLRQ